MVSVTSSPSPSPAEGTTSVVRPVREPCVAKRFGWGAMEELDWAELVYYSVRQADRQTLATGGMRSTPRT